MKALASSRLAASRRRAIALAAPRIRSLGHIALLSALCYPSMYIECIYSLLSFSFAKLIDNLGVMIVAL